MLGGVAARGIVRLYVNWVRMESCISIGVMWYMLVYEASIHEGRVMGFEF